MAAHPACHPGDLQLPPLLSLKKDLECFFQNWSLYLTAGSGEGVTVGTPALGVLVGAAGGVLGGSLVRTSLWLLPAF